MFNGPNPLNDLDELSFSDGTEGSEIESDESEENPLDARIEEEGEPEPVLNQFPLLHHHTDLEDDEDSPNEENHPKFTKRQ